jgi:mRNA interferase RelE/StbE
MPDQPVPKWRIIIDRDARRSMRRLPDPLLARLTSAIDKLAFDPRPPGCLKLTGYSNLWRIRVGDWRILYVIHDDRLVIVVTDVESRAIAYRNL